MLNNSQVTRIDTLDDLSFEYSGTVLQPKLLLRESFTASFGAIRYGMLRKYLHLIALGLMLISESNYRTVSAETVGR